MYLFKFFIKNTFSKYFQHTFNMLLPATKLKPACIVGAVNFSGSHSRVALSRAAAQIKNLTGSTISYSTSTAETDEFFSFSVSGNKVAESDTSPVSLECLQYLEDKSTWLLIVCISFRQLGKCSVCTIRLYLHRHPWNVFFSYAGMVLTKKRGCMTDDTFEQQLLLKANSNKHLLLK